MITIPAWTATEDQISVRCSVYSRYDIRLIGLMSGHRGSPVSHLSCDRQQMMKFRVLCDVAYYWNLRRRVDGLARHAVDAAYMYAAYAAYMADVRHLNFENFDIFVTYPFLEPKCASGHQISSKSDDPWLRYSDKRIFKMAAIRHIGSVVTLSYCILEHYFRA